MTRPFRELVQQGRSVPDIYRTLTVEDVRGAADLFRPLYEEIGGTDGFVSCEVSPELATDTDATLAEVRELWRLIDRPNAMLIFGLPRYERVASAYVSGLKRRAARGESVAGVASVASFFLSRIDLLLGEDLRALEVEGEARAGQPRG